jgi:hypothetical protein
MRSLEWHDLVPSPRRALMPGAGLPFVVLGAALNLIRRHPAVSRGKKGPGRPARRRCAAVASFALGAALFLAPGLVPAQGDPLHIPRLSGPIEMTGTGEDPAWAGVEPIHLIAHSPDYGGEPTEPTEVRVAHDGRYLYVFARLHDAEPEGIQALSLRRNDGDISNDWFVVVLDTFSDSETGVMFGTTPAGIRTDVEILNDAQLPTDLNFDWNTFWDVEVAQDDGGWSAELRIPFSSLRFQDRDGRVTMGLSFWRVVARKQEFSAYPARPPRWGFMSVSKPSLTRPVALEGVESRRPLHAIPYVLVGGAQEFMPNETGDGFERLDAPAHEVGLDVRYGLTDNLTLDVAVNPDFAQVEADEQQINLTRFDLFFPEKRRFFQERSSAFDFSLGGNDRLFHSRRIGIADGEMVRIWGGGRVAGRVGEWDVGALNMQTGNSAALPSENFGVVRLRRSVVNDHSHLGGIVTSRIGREGEYNIAYGLDSSLNLFDQDFLTINWAQTYETADGPLAPLERGFARIRWERRGVEGFGYALDVSRAGSGFDPGVGFMLRNDYTRIGERLYYGWRPDGESAVYRHTVALNSTLYRSNTHGITETAVINPTWMVETRRGHTFVFSTGSTYEHLRDGFSLAPDIHVPAGRYWSHGAITSYGMPAGRPLRTSVVLAGMTFYGGRMATFSLTPRWRVSRHLDLSGAYSLSHVAFPDRDQELTGHVLRTRVEVMFSTALSAATFVQYNTAADALISNVRIRFNPREGQDLYVVYNHGLHPDRHRLQPFLPMTGSRTLLIKYSHPFDLGF